MKPPRGANAPTAVAPKSAEPGKNRKGIVHSAPRCVPRPHTQGVTDSFREQMIAFLPRLSGFALSLTGNADQRDDLVQETCARALAHRDQWQPGTRLDSWMFRIAQNLWFDRKRAAKNRGEPVDIEAIENLAGSDGRRVMESRLALAEVLRWTRPALAGASRVDSFGVRGRPYLPGGCRRSGAAHGDRHEQAGSCPARAPRCDQPSASIQGKHETGDAPWPKFQMSC